MSELDQSYHNEISHLPALSEAEFKSRYEGKRFVEVDFGGSLIKLHDKIVMFARIREFVSLLNECRVPVLAEPME
jgi:hypothetical protein